VETIYTALPLHLMKDTIQQLSVREERVEYTSHPIVLPHFLSGHNVRV